jgi:methylated-DNA-[protein]-cysteine S-methyltransferase
VKPDRRQPGLRSEIAIGTNEKSDARSQEDIESLKKTLSRIQTHPTLSTYRKRLYTTLLSVPRGRYTTYAAMSDYLHSSARAVGNGMRNNPFAPEVPCHRVLAANGSIGGFNGEWGKDGKYANKKIELLRDEGVRFHVNGKVIGEPFRNLHTFKDIDH